MEKEDEPIQIPPPVFGGPISIAIGGSIGFCTGVLHNHLRKRPLLAAPLTNLLPYTLVMGGLGFAVSSWRYNQAIKRQRYVEDYVRLHPEYFQDPKRKWADVYRPWRPNR